MGELVRALKDVFAGKDLQKSHLDYFSKLLIQQDNSTLSSQKGLHTLIGEALCNYGLAKDKKEALTLCSTLASRIKNGEMPVVKKAEPKSKATTAAAASGSTGTATATAAAPKPSPTATAVPSKTGTPAPSNIPSKTGTPAPSTIPSKSGTPAPGQAEKAEKAEKATAAALAVPALQIPFPVVDIPSTLSKKVSTFLRPNIDVKLLHVALAHVLQGNVAAEPAVIAYLAAVLKQGVAMRQDAVEALSGDLIEMEIVSSEPQAKDVCTLVCYAIHGESFESSEEESKRTEKLQNRAAEKSGRKADFAKKAELAKAKKEKKQAGGEEGEEDEEDDDENDDGGVVESKLAGQWVNATAKDLSVGQQVQARYSDRRWYAGVVDGVEGSRYRVIFSNYGNQEEVGMEDLKVRSVKPGSSSSSGGGGTLLAAPVRIGDIMEDPAANRRKKDDPRGLVKLVDEGPTKRKLKKEKLDKLKAEQAERREIERRDRAEKMRKEALEIYLKSDHKSKSKEINTSEFGMSTPDGGTELLANASLRFFPGRRYGLIGRNGIGKTTLLRHISFYEVPKFPTHLRVVHVEQEVSGEAIGVIESVLSADVEREALLSEEKRLQERAEELEKTGEHDAQLTGRLAAIYGRMKEIDVWGAEARACAILSGLSFSQERMKLRTNQLSGGWRMRVALAQALFVNPDLLLLDEPTNHLDFPAVIWLEEYLQKFENTLIIVSHDRFFINNVITDVIHFNDLKLEYYKGNYDTFEKVRLDQIKNQQKLFESQQTKKEHMQAFIDKFRYNAKRASLVQSRIKALKKMDQIDEIEEESLFTFQFPEVEPIEHTLVSCRDVSFSYNKEKVLLKNVSCSVDVSSRIAILGANGVGKSTLINLLIGNLEATEGNVHRNAHARISTFTQHHMDQLKPHLCPLDLLMEMFPKNHPQVIRRHLGSFGITGNLALQRIQTLSGGQKSRVAFAIVTWKKPHLLMLDEPTNHLDLETIEALIGAIQAWNGGVLLVSHDQHFLKSVGTDFWGVSSGLVQRFDSFEAAKNFSYSREQYV